MSSVFTLSPEAPETPARSWRRRGPRSMNDGSALVARGEPLIWLTCAALVLVLAMILGLVLLILNEGLQTFWPLPLLQVDRAGASPLLGEVNRTETYLPAADQIARFPAGPYREQAERGEPIRRRLIRTGNFEITQQHFDEVADYEIGSAGESYPEWAVILERVTWGRFYGEPEAYVVRHPRTVSGDEEQLENLITFFEQNLRRLDDAARPEVTTALAGAKKQLGELRQKSTALLVAQVKESAAPDTVLTAVAGKGTSPQPLDKVAPNTVLFEVQETWTTPEAAWKEFRAHHDAVRAQYAKQVRIEKHEIGQVNAASNDARLRVRGAELDTAHALEPRVDELSRLTTEIAGLTTQEQTTRNLVRQADRRFTGTPLAAAARRIGDALLAENKQARATRETRLEKARAALGELPDEARAAVEDAVAVRERVAKETEQLLASVSEIRRENDSQVLRMRTASGRTVDLKVADIVRGYPANQLGFAQKLGVYFSRWGEFLTDDPREANSEGGVFPAIWGTVAMTLIMSFAVVPFGVLAALYLREYAGGGWIVSIIRIAVNNLAGVPSIVFGIFGLGFFCYFFGSYIDGGPANAGLTPWPPARWFFVLAALAVIAVASFAFGIVSMSSRKAEASHAKRWMSRLALAGWIVATILLVLLIAKTPFFHGFYRTSLPTGTFGKGGLLWASLTLSLMTLPVVIVATEEALAAVPNSMREGSYACGASKWQTIARIVLPRALPGVMTGMILAMARGAGEVAPLMLVGAVKIAQDLPVDLEAPFVHPERSFMHLGFHIFDLGFQSPNVNAAKPMVFTTTLLLIVIIATLNLSAIWLRGRLRRRYRTAQF